MQKKNRDFVDAMLPVIQTVKGEYLTGYLKNPEGITYGCGYCDMYPKNHSNDCLAQQAVNCFEKILEIKNKNYHVVEESNIEIQYREMFYVIFNEFVNPNLTYFIPTDYSDPSNKNIGCPCIHAVFGRKREHSNHCIILKTAKALSRLYG